MRIWTVMHMAHPQTGGSGRRLRLARVSVSRTGALAPCRPRLGSRVAARFGQRRLPLTPP